MKNNEELSALLTPHDEGVDMEIYTCDGVWLMSLSRNNDRTFLNHLDEQACQWRKGDPDMYEMMKGVALLGDKQLDSQKPQKRKQK